MSRHWLLFGGISEPVPSELNDSNSTPGLFDQTAWIFMAGPGRPPATEAVTFRPMHMQSGRSDLKEVLKLTSNTPNPLENNIDFAHLPIIIIGENIAFPPYSLLTICLAPRQRYFVRGPIASLRPTHPESLSSLAPHDCYPKRDLLVYSPSSITSTMACLPLCPTDATVLEEFPDTISTPNRRPSARDEIPASVAVSPHQFVTPLFSITHIHPPDLN